MVVPPYRAAGASSEAVPSGGQPLAGTPARDAGAPARTRAPDGMLRDSFLPSRADR